MQPGSPWNMAPQQPSPPGALTASPVQHATLGANAQNTARGLLDERAQELERQRQEEAEKVATQQQATLAAQRQADAIAATKLREREQKRAFIVKVRRLKSEAFWRRWKRRAALFGGGYVAGRAARWAYRRYVGAVAAEPHEQKDAYVGVAGVGMREREGAYRRVPQWLMHRDRRSGRCRSRYGRRYGGR